MARSSRSLFLLAFCCCLSSKLAFSADTAALVQEKFIFEANQGQFSPDVDFAHHGTTRDVFLKKDGAWIRVRSRKQTEAIRLRLGNRAQHNSPLPTDKVATEANYFAGRRESWRTRVPQYGRVV